MSDLLDAVPDFDTKPFGELLHALDRAAITTADLLTLDPQHVAKRASRPTEEVKRLAHALTGTLHRDLGFGAEEHVATANFLAPREDPRDPSRQICPWLTISTLDEKLDAALGGGLAAGYLVEVTGER